MSSDTATDSLTTKVDKSPPKIKKKKTIISKVSLSINTIPEKVDVFLDGSFIGKTPISGQKILSGDRIFEIRKDGFAPISYDLNVNPSKSVNLDFFMNPIYNVKFKTDEVGLIFELNEVHRWTEDAIRMQLEAGDHQLRVYKLGEIVDEQVIVADQPLTFQYYLKRGVVIKP
ncbi:MAG: PEGA domain-containing protein [Candidatus Neomarinimicrobiota bacterium]